MLFLLTFSTSVIAAPPLRVAVLDTGLDLTDVRLKKHLCTSGHKDFTGKGLYDTNSHGTHVAGLIQKYAGNSNYCLIIYKYYDEELSPRQLFQSELAAISEALKQKVDIINFSGGGTGYAQAEYLLIKNHPKTRFIVAAGNDGRNLDTPQYKYYPASYDLKNVTAVANRGRDGYRESSSNFGHKTVWEMGQDVLSTCPENTYCTKNGSSMSTGIHTGKIIYDLTH